MKKKLILLSLLSSLSLNLWANDKNRIDISLIDNKQIGHSDGYSTKGWGFFKKEVFTGTNIYFSNMNITHDGKIISILSGFTLTEINKNESIEHPSNVFIGDLQNNTKGSSALELEKLKSIGVTKEEFEQQLKTQFKEIYFM